MVIHVPVMLKEVLDGLRIKDNGVYVDGTIGTGGHAEGILKGANGCTVIGIDRDDMALEIAGQRLSGYNLHLIRESFSNMDLVIKSLGYDGVDGILLDLGVSTLQLREEGRGFSFMSDEPLDMRMDRRQKLTAYEIVNNYPQDALATLLYRYGEERFSRRIARAIVKARQRSPITSCKELAEIIERAIGRRGRLHPATRTFQALRIEVNKELDELSMAIDKGAGILRSGGRFCILSYHSLEDRIVKNAYKRLASQGIFNIITKKPLRPSTEEVLSNPSSRSARLRIGERI
ncbi:MAG: 16S rRNA (cytosine(1402)-N(4))-methyltransferase RsmH [Thermodesulfovibrionia bacterium]